jgi:phytanoyl-CoA hydroxylase
VSSPPIAGRLQQLFEQSVVMPLAHHNCIMTKQPGYSSDTGWHQDIRYWSFSRPELVSLWLALGVENLENGCLKIIPGSHRMQFPADGFDEQRFWRPEIEAHRELAQSAFVAELEPGDVLFFHCCTRRHATSRSGQSIRSCSRFGRRTIRRFQEPGRMHCPNCCYRACFELGISQ